MNLDIDDLVAWLLKQLDEDEAWALLEPNSDHWPWGPANPVLDCAAKRQIVKHIASSTAAYQQDAGNPVAARAIADLRQVLKLLALPYARRPGYREEWRTPWMPTHHQLDEGSGHTP